jgi:N-acetylmuramate 1-kinase
MLTRESNDLRYLSLIQWLKKLYPDSAFNITPLAGDASFRRYYRIQLMDQSLVAMDSPPDKEDCQPFIDLAHIFAKQGLHVPHIYHIDTAQGFLLLSDLGDELYSRCLASQNADCLYQTAIDQLHIIQTISPQAYAFPSFSAELFREELTRFQEWYLEKHLNLELTLAERNMLSDTFEVLIQNALEQPQVCVHRDYHSRNLLKLLNQNLGILDFQDAVWGPITYDLVSLIRDCYIDWPKHKVMQWATYFYEGITTFRIDSEQFLRWFDLMGVQRHLKATYIFARKFRRDDTPTYLSDIPRALNYVCDVAQAYPELHPLREFLMRVAAL